MQRCHGRRGATATDRTVVSLRDVGIGVDGCGVNGGQNANMVIEREGELKIWYRPEDVRLRDGEARDCGLGNRRRA